MQPNQQPAAAASEQITGQAFGRFRWWFPLVGNFKCGSSSEPDQQQGRDRTNSQQRQSFTWSTASAEDPASDPLQGIGVTQS